jgi:hypothetical protein
MLFGRIYTPGWTWPTNYPDDAFLRGSLRDIGWIDPEPEILPPPCTEVLRQCNCDFGGDDTNS